MNKNFYSYISLCGLSFLKRKNFDQLRMFEKDFYLFLKNLAIRNYL